MEEKDKFEALIVSYILNELDEQASMRVEELLNSDPALRRLFEDLDKSIKLVALKNSNNNIDVGVEWKVFEEARVRKQYPEIFIREAETFGNGVIKEMSFKRRTKIFRVITTVAVAASVVFAIGWGWSLLRPQQPTSTNEVAAAYDRETARKPVMRELINRSAKEKNFILPDGTEVMLAPNSSLRFYEPLGENSRNIRLDGIGRFDVAKDSLRPFTVFSHGISTTAVGTVFTVKAFRTSGRIIITLYEGKVVVRGVEDLQNKLGKPHHMLPGQEFVYDKNKKASRVYLADQRVPKPDVKRNDFKRNNDAAFDDKPLTPNLDGSWFMFNNESLENVFYRLGKIFKTEIIYNKDDIRKIYFIGTFSEKDSLEHVLKQICTLNNLQLGKVNNQYVITK